MRRTSSSFRLLAVTVAALLVAAGCSTTSSVRGPELQKQLRGGAPARIVIQDEGGSFLHVDPNSELRFFLHNGEVTRWVHGRELWVSDLGLSFAEEDGVCFLAWKELAGAEVLNLSGAKTFGAIVVVAVVVGLIVLALGKGGGGSPGGGSISGGGKAKSAKLPSGVRPAHHRLVPRGHGGIHVHALPVVIAVGGSVEHRADGPPPALPPPPPSSPPPPPPPPGPTQPAAPGQAQIHDIDYNAPAQAQPPPPPAPRPARPLFTRTALRRATIQLTSSGGAETDFLSRDGMSVSLVAGMRVHDVFELCGGLRELVVAAPADDGKLHAYFVGIGRLGTHLELDAGRYFAIPLSIDAGAGPSVVLHLRLNFGLRVRLPYNLSIGLLPFNPSYTHFRDSSVLRDAEHWRFPSTLEVGFTY